MKRLGKRARTLMRVSVCVAFTLLFAAAGAHTALAYEYHGRHYWPANVSQYTYSVKFVRLANTDPDEPERKLGTYLLYGSKSATRYYFAELDSVGQLVNRRVTYSTWLRMVRADRSGNAPATVDWAWRTNSAGKRYRYIRSITLWRAGV